MKCPKCSSNLEKKTHKGIEVDYCNNCKGMWLDLEELDQLEDTVFDEDKLKGTLIFSSTPTEYHCPHCGSQLRSFKYRLHSLELEYCENEHGFWLDEGEEKRVIELIKARSKSMQRKFDAEIEWEETLRRLKSKSFFSRLAGLFK